MPDSSDTESLRPINSGKLIEIIKIEKNLDFPFGDVFATKLREAEQRRQQQAEEEKKRRLQAEQEVIDQWKAGWNFDKDQVGLTRTAIIEEIKSYLHNHYDESIVDELSDALYWLREAELSAKSPNPKPPKKADLTEIAFWTFQKLTVQPPKQKARHPNLLRLLAERYNKTHHKNQIGREMLAVWGDQAGPYNPKDFFKDIKLPEIKSREPSPS